jgi:hypothetical protein
MPNNIYRKKINIYSEDHTEPLNIFRGQKCFNYIFRGVNAKDETELPHAPHYIQHSSNNGQQPMSSFCTAV